MGVWIETCPSRYTQTASEVTPFVGVWIETLVAMIKLLALTRHTLRGCVD